MKKQILTILLILISINISFAGEVEVPADVKAKFDSRYPNAKKIVWGGSKKLYGASFELNNTKYEVYFDEKGNFIVEASSVRISELPKSAIVYVSNDSLICKVDVIGRLIDAKNDTTYQVKGETKRVSARRVKYKAINVNFDAKGKVLFVGRCFYTQFPFFYRTMRLKKKKQS